jgi:uncharacterized membrane protein
VSNNYSAPNAALVERQEVGGSLESGLEGNYSVSISEIISEAWQKTKGIKRLVLGAGAIMYVAIFVVMFALSMMLALFASEDTMTSLALITQLVVQIAMMAVMLPFAAGIFVICLKHIRGQQPEFGDAFSCFGKTGTLVITMILMYIMIFIGFLLFVIPGIYLSWAYVLAIPLIVDRDMSPWEALETSRKAITKKWFSVFGLFFVLGLIMVVSMLPLFIGLIWTVPMMSVAMAILYRNVFGITSY